MGNESGFMNYGVASIVAAELVDHADDVDNKEEELRRLLLTHPEMYCEIKHHIMDCYIHKIHRLCDQHEVKQLMIS